MITTIPFDTSTNKHWDTIAQTNLIQAPFYFWPWHHVWNETINESWKPYPLLFDNTIIAPFARKENTVIFSGGEEVSDYQDIIGPDSEKQKAWREILSFLKKDGVTSMQLRNIPENSPTLTFFQAFSSTQIKQEDTTPRLTLTSSWDDHKETLPYKARHELERKIRKFHREHEQYDLQESADPERDIAILFSLMEEDEKKKLFLTDAMKAFFRGIFHSYAPSISLLILTIGDKPIAATVSFRQDKTYFLYNSGFDRQHHSNAGFYIKAMSLKYAFNHGYREYNFLQGQERYKYELGGKDFGVYEIVYKL